MSRFGSCCKLSYAYFSWNSFPFAWLLIGNTKLKVVTRCHDSYFWILTDLVHMHHNVQFHVKKLKTMMTENEFFILIFQLNSCCGAQLLISYIESCSGAAWLLCRYTEVKSSSSSMTSDFQKKKEKKGSRSPRTWLQFYFSA